MFFGADDLEPATQGDTGEKREVRKPENARNESSSKIDPDILQSYGRARSSNATWHNVDVTRENMFLIFDKVELNKAWIMGVTARTGVIFGRLIWQFFHILNRIESGQMQQ